MPLEPTPHPEHLRAWHGSVPVASRYTVGPAGERFFRALRDHAQLLATPCRRCGVTYVPGRLFCERCFDELAEWVEVGPTGTVVALTRVHLAADGSPLAAPARLALVRLDGADTVLLHYLEGAAPDHATIGLRVAPAFKPAGERTGSILDIVGFRAI
jgi:hypothetical protein